MVISEKSLINLLTDFVRSIGIPVQYGKLPVEKEFLPGICIRQSGLLLDPDRLKYPGDILHEAGHLAVASPGKRALMDGILEGGSHEDQAEEMMAIAWSYAAAVHIGIDPHIVFHEDGYQKGGSGIVENFSEGRYFGVCTLQWIGLTYEARTAKEPNIEPYPKMIKWLRE